MYKELIDELYRYIVAYEIADEYDAIPTKEDRNLNFSDYQQQLVEEFNLADFENHSPYDIMSLLRNFIEIKYNEYHKEEV